MRGNIANLLVVFLAMGANASLAYVIMRSAVRGVRRSTAELRQVDRRT